MTKIELDDYVIDTLLPDLVGHDRRPAAFLVYVSLWRHCRRPPRVDDEKDVVGRCRRSLRELAEGTGLSRRAVQAAIGHLHGRQLIGIRRDSMTAVPEYRVRRPWRRRQPRS